MGDHIWHVHEKKLWEELEVKSYTAWVESLHMSRQTANDAMKCWHELHKLDGYEEIPRENAKVLVKEVVASKRKRYLKAAKTMPHRQFRAFVAGGKVGAARAEETVQKHFIFTLPQWAVIEQAVQTMMVHDEAGDTEQALEHLAAEYNLTHQEIFPDAESSAVEEQ